MCSSDCCKICRKGCQASWRCCLRLMLVCVVWSFSYLLLRNYSIVVYSAATFTYEIIAELFRRIKVYFSKIAIYKNLPTQAIICKIIVCRCVTPIIIVFIEINYTVCCYFHNSFASYKMRCGRLEACQISRMILSKSYILLIFSISYKIFSHKFLEKYKGGAHFTVYILYPIYTVYILYIHIYFYFFLKSLLNRMLSANLKEKLNFQ